MMLHLLPFETGNVGHVYSDVFIAYAIYMCVTRSLPYTHDSLPGYFLIA